jgi:hypothetical protein
MEVGSRITLQDTFMSAAIKVAEGNPGAITAILELCKLSPSVDPESWSRNFAPLFSLDTHRIYGSNVWRLYKDAHDCSALKTLTTLRCIQMGIITEREVFAAMSRERKLDHDDLLKRLQEKLPSFAAATEAA